MKVRTHCFPIRDIFILYTQTKVILLANTAYIKNDTGISVSLYMSTKSGEFFNFLLRVEEQ
jgi:uncharacterized membrane protein